MRKSVYALWLLAALAVSCGRKPRAGMEKNISPKAFIFHPFLFQEEMHTQLHYPYWFSAEIVSAAHIRQIVRLTYAGLEDDPENPGSRETFPRLKTIYTFSPEGRLVLLQEIYFADGLEISRRTYSMDESSDYPLPHAVEEAETDTDEDATDGFVLFSELRSAKEFMEVRERKDGRRHIFLPGKKYWGGLSVESLTHPSPRDWVVLGRPEKPLKRYQVKNTVTQSNVSHYSYAGGNFPKAVSWADYPFSQRRTFHYENGVFSGFTDSTFMDHSYITRTITTFRKGSNGFPAKVIRRSDHSEDRHEFSAVEIFRYITFTNP